MNGETNRIVWRYENGYLSENDLARGLNEAIAQLITNNPARSGGGGAVTRWASALIQKLDDLIDAARDSLAAREYRHCSEIIPAAAKVLATTKSMIDVSGEFQSVLESYNDIVERVESEDLIRLRTIRTIGGLVAEAESSLNKLEYRQARFITRLSKSKLDALQEKDGDNEDRRLLISNRISDLDGLRRKAAEVGQNGTVGLLSEGCVASLSRVVSESRLNLAECLVADLEFDITGAAVFLRTVRSFPQVHPSDWLIDLGEAESVDHWSMATMGVLTDATQTMLSEMQSLNARAVAVRDQLNAVGMES